MGRVGEWISSNWFNFLSAVGIIGSLLFTAVSLRTETKARRIGNLLNLTDSHREVLSQLVGNPHLSRVLDASADLSKHPVTGDERLCVTIIIQHLNSTFEALKAGLVIKPEGLRKDVGAFLSLPIPDTVWQNLKALQNDDFVEFVDSCVKGVQHSDKREESSA
jgi:hypothetical protein